jgi:hypothetical protein
MEVRVPGNSIVTGRQKHPGPFVNLIPNIGNGGRVSSKKTAKAAVKHDKE